MNLDPAWRTWQQACAFGLIPEADRARLHRVVGERFRSRVKRLTACGSCLPQLDDAACAHLFESWCALHQRRDGKRYKDWLLTRGDRDQDAVESGVMLLVRNVVREWIRTQHRAVAELSLDAPLMEASGCTLRELLPGEERGRTEEQSAWMEEAKLGFVSGLKPVERSVLWVRSLGKVYSHPEVKHLTGFGKTALHEAHRGLLNRLAGEVRDRFPGISAADGTSLVLDLMDQAGKILQETSGKQPDRRLRGVE